MRQTKEIAFVGNLVHEAVTCGEDEEIEAVANRIIDRAVNHIVVVDGQKKLLGIVTSWDITKATAQGKEKLKETIVRRVHTTTLDDPLEAASLRMAQNNISALPVIDRDGKVQGIVTSEDISRLLGGA